MPAGIGFLDAAKDSSGAGTGVRLKSISPMSTNPSACEPMLVSMKTACALTSLSRTMLNRYRAEGRFPAAVQLGDKRMAFVRQEVNQWIADRIAARAANDNTKRQVAA